MEHDEADTGAKINEEPLTEQHEIAEDFEWIDFGAGEFQEVVGKFFKMVFLFISSLTWITYTPNRREQAIE